MISYSNTSCIGCGKDGAQIFFDVKYNGLRGKCKKCGGDWPES